MAANGREFVLLRQLKILWDEIFGALDGKANKTHTHTGSQVTGLTRNRVAVSSSTGALIASDVTSTQLGYIGDLTSGAQGQINSLSSRVSALETAASSGGVDVARTTSHKTTYDRDTLEIVTDSSGRVTDMWFVSAD